MKESKWCLCVEVVSAKQLRSGDAGKAVVLALEQAIFATHKIEARSVRVTYRGEIDIFESKKLCFENTCRLRSEGHHHGSYDCSVGFQCNLSRH